MIDLTKPIRRKSLNPHLEGFHVRKITPDASFRIEYENGAWTMIGSLEELEKCYENIPEPRKPREWVLEGRSRIDGSCTDITKGYVLYPGENVRAIEWPKDAPLPDWPEGY